ncbi:hypothetical protein PUNSTDRAFT_141696 [Punctularia strigosozonata HHB-11173 SS5]|uniref:uncharacterized protein n=1 Tax=Punctularia strigosozonata (strain HHB-11173) TaxID=741275 RepID=UPI0004417402|nr:uncharacterized protein PUNSTDRAFT_141696 [Punctularia strigosozonata HHB-11173 SS5]EIN11280.1 hypothetical protein PUNSTDRAFT_141696 [Punctularia strigosozonata HHB-11173 SS5]
MATVVFNYVEDANPNLVCCICRAPFVEPCTTRTCSHTFCRPCIIRSLEVSEHCPVDRSTLCFEDLEPPNPLVRNLVDELVVECPQRSAGCDHRCQRQLLSSHVAECEYVAVECPIEGCSEVVQKKNATLDVHERLHCAQSSDDVGSEVESEDEGEILRCDYCSESIGRITGHRSDCPLAPTPCTHASSGCPFNGTLASLPDHLLTCPYEAIKGFLSLQASRDASLAAENARLREENAVLKQRFGAMEGMMEIMRREMQALKGSLGPWYRRDVEGDLYAPTTTTSEDFGVPEVEFPEDLVASPDSSIPPSSPELVNLAAYFPPAPADDAGSTAGSPSAPPSSRRRQSFTPLLPGATPYSTSPMSTQTQLNLYSPSIAPYFPHLSIPYHAHGYASSPSQVQQIQTPAQTPLSHASSVAPLNLSTSLEGTLNGLRDSIVALASALDSVGRRSELTLATETLRLNEDIGSVRAVLHGLRMQVHSIMMDRNAQVTGRPNDAPSGPARLVPGMGAALHPPMPLPSPFPKL